MTQANPLPDAPVTVARLLAQLTLDEKISLLHGNWSVLEKLGEAGVIPGVPRLGIPPLRLSDGPSGVRVTARATALPAPVALASTFDPALAHAYGTVIGREGRALQQNVQLAPMVNLVRTPYGGRNFETFGEDPLLISDIAVAQIQGIQEQGMIATVKHLAANSQEHDRQTVDAIVDEQTLREMELPAFEAAVRAGVGSVMAAYNSVNGAFACESPELLDELLRQDWGFDGWVMTDWWAAHSTQASLTAGLDMEMPTGKYFGRALKEAVEAGEISETLVDRAVDRILTVMDRFGLLEASADAAPPRDPAFGAEIARQVAVAGAVLLRNEHATLPLTGAAARSIAVIGMTGSVPFVSGGGSSHVVPDHADSPLQALRARAGGAEVAFAAGVDWCGKDIPAEDLSPAVLLDVTGTQAIPPGRSWSYDGTLCADEDDEWTFVLHWSHHEEWTQEDDAVPIYNRPAIVFDGEELFPVQPGWEELFTGGLVGTSADGLALRSATRNVTKGTHTLSIRADADADGMSFRLRRETPATRAADLAEAVSAARSAETTVVFAWQDATEGKDLETLALPAAQDELISAVAAVTPRTVVVLNTATSVTMPWLPDTAAVLQMWYSGQQGAQAAAELLFGDENPSGRLPVSCPADEESHPMAGDPARYPGTDGRVTYSEGIHVGYRWYDAYDVEPLFPFGHGLSYTEFTYADLRTEAATETGVEVSFTLRNTGTRSGAEVVQIYLGPSPDLGLPQAVRKLAAYRRLTLAPGEEQRVRLMIGRRQLSSWSPSEHDWVLGTGERAIAVGASSRDLRLHGVIRLHA